MGREHKAAAAVAAAAGRPAAVQKHKKRARFRDHEHAIPAGLVARPAIPKSKHKTIYEWAENTDKKKKLEIEASAAFFLGHPRVHTNKHLGYEQQETFRQFFIRSNR
jgi:hypothetical protein